MNILAIALVALLYYADRLFNFRRLTHFWHDKDAPMNLRTLGILIADHENE